MKSAQPISQSIYRSIDQSTNQVINNQPIKLSASYQAKQQTMCNSDLCTCLTRHTKPPVLLKELNTAFDQATTAAAAESQAASSKIPFPSSSQPTPVNPPVPAPTLATSAAPAVSATPATHHQPQLQPPLQPQLQPQLQSQLQPRPPVVSSHSGNTPTVGPLGMMPTAAAASGASRLPPAPAPYAVRPTGSPIASSGTVTFWCAVCLQLIV